MHDVCYMTEKRVRRLMLTLRKTLKRKCLAWQARNAEIRLPSLFQDPVQRALRRRKDENERLNETETWRPQRMQGRSADRNWEKWASLFQSRRSCKGPSHRRGRSRA